MDETREAHFPDRVGTAGATRIVADFTGTDCQLATFAGQAVLPTD